jgi:hypothetical protein
MNNRGKGSGFRSKNAEYPDAVAAGIDNPHRPVAISIVGRAFQKRLHLRSGDVCCHHRPLCSQRKCEEQQKSPHNYCAHEIFSSQTS